jgi:hypothetical protein
VIKALKEGLVANRILSIMGIMNGTANYILTRMTDEGIPFAEVLKRPSGWDLPRLTPPTISKASIRPISLPS